MGFNFDLQYDAEIRLYQTLDKKQLVQIQTTTGIKICLSN